MSITSYVLDDEGHIVGRNEGCFQTEVRPEHSWSCMGSGGEPPPLAKAGAYDIVFAINDRPVAWWPMEATLRRDSPSSSEMQRWLQDMRRIVVPPPHHHH